MKLNILIVAAALLLVAVLTHIAVNRSSVKISPEECQLHAELAQAILQARQAGVSKDFAYTVSSNTITDALVESIYAIPKDEMNNLQVANKVYQTIYDTCMK